MSNYTMQIEILGSPIRCETNGRLVCLNDLLTAGNKVRMVNNQPVKQLYDILNTKAFDEFVQAVQRKTRLDRCQLLKAVKGRNGRTMANILIAVYIAEQLSPDFHVEVISTFVEGKLLEFREYGGTEFRSLNVAIDAAMQIWEDRNAHNGHFIAIANLLRRKILGDEDVSGWAKASVAQTHRRYEMEKFLVQALSCGLIVSWDNLKEAVDRL